MSEFGAEEVDLDVLDSRVYVGNLPWAIRDDELREAFEPVGTVTDAKVSASTVSHFVGDWYTSVSLAQYPT